MGFVVSCTTRVLKSTCGTTRRSMTTTTTMMTRTMTWRGRTNARCHFAFPQLLTIARSHVSDATLSPLLPSTKNEPRLPKSEAELSERLQPLLNLWGFDSTSPFLTMNDSIEPTSSSPSPSSSSSSSSPILTKDQLLSVLSLPLPGEPGYKQQDDSSTTAAILRALYTAANVVCTQHHGDKVHYRGLLEFSNICRSDCNYCGIRRSIHLKNRYLLDEETIMEVAHWSAERKYGSIMLQSGEVRTKQRLEFLCRVIRRIVDETGMGVSLSVGELPDEYYEQLREAGAKRYLLRIETSNPKLFAKLHPPEQTFESRLERLRSLRKTGFMLGTGVMIGLPGQTRKDLAEDLLFFRRENVDMIGMGPYILQRGTPTGNLWQTELPELYAATLAKESKTATPEQLALVDTHGAAMFELTTRMVALARILLRDVNIAATTALQTIHPTGREVALMRGANIMMPILTPTSHRAHYQLYEGKVCVDESAKQCRSCLELRVSAAGKRIAYGEHGDPPHALRRMKQT